MTASLAKRPAKRKSSKFYLSVDGPGVTDIFRTSFLGGNPSAAYRLVMESFEAMEATDVQLLLEGKRKLVGIARISTADTLELVDDNAKKHARLVKRIYAGRVRLDGAWWRPRATVSVVNQRDAEYAIRRGATESDDQLRTFAKERLAYYLQDGERVFEVSEPNEVTGALKRSPTFVIFEPCPEAPFWWKELPTAGAALKEFLAAGQKLEDRATDEPSAAAPSALQAFEEEQHAEDVVEQQERLEEIRWQAEEAAEKAKIAAWRDAILDQANGDFLELHLEDGTTRSVPRAPFVRWAFRHGALHHLAPPWKSVAPSGLKLPLDSSDHSDWMIGGGCDLGGYYGSALSRAADEASFRLVVETGTSSCVVLVEGRDQTGRIGGDIVVLPNLHPDHLPKLRLARAILTQAGGALAHLAQVALERQIPILLIPDALTRFPVGSRVTVRPSAGTVTLETF